MVMWDGAFVEERLPGKPDGRLWVWGEILHRLLSHVGKTRRSFGRSFGDRKM
jgi:hypothetical protein